MLYLDLFAESLMEYFEQHDIWNGKSNKKWFLFWIRIAMEVILISVLFFFF